MKLDIVLCEKFVNIGFSELFVQEIRNVNF